MHPVELDQLVLHPPQPAQHERNLNYVFIAFVQQLEVDIYSVHSILSIDESPVLGVYLLQCSATAH